MKRTPHGGRIDGFTLFEAVILTVIVAVLIALFCPPLVRPQGCRASASRINCTSNLKQVGLGFWEWAQDHNNKFPMQLGATNGGTMEWIGPAKVFPHFLVLSNELNTPKVLVCPADKPRVAAVSFQTNFTDAHISYFVGVDATPAFPQMFLDGDWNITNRLGFRSGLAAWATNEVVGWTHELHGLQGNVGLADGSVQGFSRSRMREALQWTGLATNRLGMP